MTVQNVWALYNLRRSPFFQDGLGPEPDATYPLELFVGRAEETARLVRIVTGAEQSRQVVQGAPGVGKTTFAQYVKSELSREGYISGAAAVAVGSSDTAAELLHRVLSYCYQVVLANGDATTAEREPMAVARQLLRAFSTRSGGISLSLGGVGAGVTGAVQHVTSPDALSLMAPRLLAELAALARTHLGAKGLVVHLNNLENLSDADEARTGRILRDLRDPMLMVPGLHYLIVGTESAIRAGLLAHPQLRSVVHPHPPLGPLSRWEVRELLRRRYAHLVLDPERPVHHPVQYVAVDEIYGLFAGDLRGTLRALEQAAAELLGIAGESPHAPMRLVDMRPVLAGLHADEIDAALGDAAAAHLAALAERFGAAPFTQAEAGAALRLSAGHVSQVVTELRRRGYLEPAGKRERPGRRGRPPELFALTGAVRLAYGV